jgi:hypothetical protein
MKMALWWPPVALTFLQVSLPLVSCFRKLKLTYSAHTRKQHADILSLLFKVNRLRRRCDDVDRFHPTLGIVHWPSLVDAVVCIGEFL